VAINYKRQKYKAKKHILHKKSLKTKIIKTYDKDLNKYKHVNFKLSAIRT